MTIAPVSIVKMELFDFVGGGVSIGVGEGVGNGRVDSVFIKKQVTPAPMFC